MKENYSLNEQNLNRIYHVALRHNKYFPIWYKKTNYQTIKPRNNLEKKINKN